MKGPSSALDLLLPFGWNWAAQEAGGGWGRRNAALALGPGPFALPRAALGAVPGWAGSCDPGLHGWILNSVG